MERRPLILPNGTEAYVEPMNLMRVGSDLVVAGAPTYTWNVGATQTRMITDRAHLAAYLDDETPRLVRMPIDVPPGIVRSVPLDGQRWAVLFSEADPAAFSQLSRAVALWYAVYDGERWSETERLPMPDGYELFVGSSSALATHDGSIGWVVVTNSGAAIHYQREDGSWALDVIEAGGMEAAALASGPSGLWLALSGVDPDLPGATKSIRLFRWNAGWEPRHRVVTVGTYTQIRGVRVTELSDGVVVTWREVSEEGSAVMARVGIGLDEPGSIHSIDASADQVLPFQTSDGGIAWIVRHIDGTTGSAELRLVRDGRERADLMWALPYPYTGYYAVAASGPDQVLVTGSEFDPDPARPTVRSLTLRLSTSCQ